jgi:antitoxin (DNA-binding transcriptional repressor) of toxin-antitoxin stability system
VSAECGPITHAVIPTDADGLPQTIFPNGAPRLSLGAASASRPYLGFSLGAAEPRIKQRKPSADFAECADFEIVMLKTYLPSRSIRPILTTTEYLTFLLDMTTVTSRDLAHRSGEIRKLLASGETLRWTSHGAPVAFIKPATQPLGGKKPDWISRARAAGAVNSNQSQVADSLYADRD